MTYLKMSRRLLLNCSQGRQSNVRTLATASNAAFRGRMNNQNALFKSAALKNSSVMWPRSTFENSTRSMSLMADTTELIKSTIESNKVKSEKFVDRLDMLRVLQINNNLTWWLVCFFDSFRWLCFPRRIVHFARQRRICSRRWTLMQK
jgi:hypothetical protein